FDIVAPDRVDQLACLDQARPARGAITTRQHELRVRELDRSPRVLRAVPEHLVRICCERGLLVRIEREARSLRVIFLEFLDRLRITPPDCAEQVLSLTFQLIEIGTNRK